MQLLLIFCNRRLIEQVESVPVPQIETPLLKDGTLLTEPKCPLKQGSSESISVDWG